MVTVIFFSFLPSTLPLSHTLGVSIQTPYIHKVHTKMRLNNLHMPNRPINNQGPHMGTLLGPLAGQIPSRAASEFGIPGVSVSLCGMQVTVKCVLH